MDPLKNRKDRLNKKRLNNNAIIPNERPESDSKKSKKLVTRPSKKYKFAPINNTGMRRPTDGVLKTISVAKIRNTSNKATNSLNSKNDLTLLEYPKPAIKAVKSQSDSDIKSTTISAADINKSKKISAHTHSLTDLSRPDFAPSQEVIWNYQPPEKDISLQEPILESDGENELLVNITTDVEESINGKVPSTPGVPQYLRGALNFSTIDFNKNQSSPPRVIQPEKDNKINELNSATDRSEFLKQSYRDIDDILGDIKDNFPIETSPPPITRLQSSPSRNKINIQEQVVKNKLSLSSDNCIDDDDDSLIDILTQMNTDNSNVKQTTMNSNIPKEEPNILSSSISSHKSAVQPNISAEPAYISKNVIADSTLQAEFQLDNNQSAKSHNFEENSAQIHKATLNLISKGNSIKNTELAKSKNCNSNLSVENIDMLDSDDSLEDSLIGFLEERPRTQRLQTIPTLLQSQPNDNNHMNTISSTNESPDVNSELSEFAKCAVERKGVVRLVIKSIKELQLPKIGLQKILTCIDKDNKTVPVIVRSPWVICDYAEKDVIHIIEGKNIMNKRLLSDDKDPKTGLINDNILILNPDLLLSATTIGTAIDCQRRAVIQSLFKDSGGEPSLPMTIGNIVHELIQEGIKHKIQNNSITTKYLQNNLTSLLENNKFSILICNSSIDEVRKEIETNHLKNVYEFLDKCIDTINKGEPIPVSGSSKTERMAISNIIDIEENIWSPMYGIKGFLDATVEIRNAAGKTIAPFEIKTGKLRNISHEAQGFVYTMLLNDRYELPIEFCLLYYSRDSHMTKYPKILNHLKHLILSRNIVSTYLKYQLNELTNSRQFRMQLPPLPHSSKCEKCPIKQQCMVLDKLLGDNEFTMNSSLKEDYSLITNHLLENEHKYRTFFQYYNDLITKEESSISSLNKEMFLLDSKTRESLSGKCLSQLTVTGWTKNSDRQESYLYTFARSNSDKEHNFLSSHLVENDMVIISDENGHFCLSQGIVQNITNSMITILVRRSLLNNKRDQTNGSIGSNSIQSVFSIPVTQEEALQTLNAVTYRIDKNEVHQSLAIARFNLLNLFLPPVDASEFIEDPTSRKVRLIKPSEGGDLNMRRILVDDIEPRFTPMEHKPLVRYDKSLLSHFNEDQLTAIDKVMRTEDYSLILGMPGTGKTTVIATIIQILVAAGKSVLLTSYTHSAVDNIILKLKNIKKSQLVRLGSPNKIHPKVLKFIPAYENSETFNEIMNDINDKSIVATTSLGIGHLLFSMREKDFDYVILDEASQISMPVALGPLRYGKKFIMVGDHYQLPPLVKNEVARLGGLAKSPFEILCEKHPNAVINLTFQYRMNKDIMKLSNFLIYENKLKCGSEKIANQKLDIHFNLNETSKDSLKKYQTNKKENNWIREILEPERRVVFLNYDNCLDIQETSLNDSISNDGEVAIIKNIIDGKMIYDNGSYDKNDDIGIMALYRGQLGKLKKRFDDEKYHGLEILTVDQFQGRDKDLVVISMVRSNERLQGGQLLKELRRVNVAMSRAKCKLIIIGSKSTIGSVVEIKSFIKLLENEGWIYDLPSNCLTTYNFAQNFETGLGNSITDSNGGTVMGRGVNVTKKGSKNITNTSNNSSVREPSDTANTSTTSSKDSGVILSASGMDDENFTRGEKEDNTSKQRYHPTKFKKSQTAIKNITSESKFVQDKAIIKQALTELKKTEFK
ncbi:hypothetical protein TBLA_0B08000 [Henningerozyma blattae CBS 6284]|uniref:DNA replication ATP-dependent helicase/nuclease DNA2 n=1 Tax=Henningerozyma blattae (strain ATCC 34711 / CBS 6284 / DSM 70876 / NBRC 10599 / NRRL Y-10934 / UCD 77-7) TaxID=1071380 RepID=I2GZR4_HENB6|nr:hypothetical protein TBLA_0B08000 [Tetrapisispora blattae CBS 6284]CCH59616.1 hypothetical protein TBLA_0B08000 [Tetrapisispora blattae CBS 6284]